MLFNEREKEGSKLETDDCQGDSVAATVRTYLDAPPLCSFLILTMTSSSPPLSSSSHSLLSSLFTSSLCLTIEIPLPNRVQRSAILSYILESRGVKEIRTSRDSFSVSPSAIPLLNLANHTAGFCERDLIYLVDEAIGLSLLSSTIPPSPSLTLCLDMITVSEECLELARKKVSLLLFPSLCSLTLFITSSLSTSVRLFHQCLPDALQMYTSNCEVPVITWHQIGGMRQVRMCVSKCQ